MLSPHAGNVLGLIRLDALPPAYPAVGTAAFAAGGVGSADDATLGQTLARLADSTAQDGKDCRICRMKGLVAKNRRIAIAAGPSQTVTSGSSQVAANIGRLTAELEVATTAAIREIAASNTAE
jgi:hypothetical protein